MRADQKENFEKIANKIVFSMLESDGILKDRMHDRFDILGFLDPNGAKFLSMYIKKRTREFFSKEPYSKKAIFEAVTSLKAINSVRKSHNFHSVKHFEDIMLVEGASKSVAEVLALLRKKINQHLSFAQFYFEDPFQTLIDLEKEIEKLEDFSKLEKYNWIVAAFESDLRDYFNKTAPAILLEKIIFGLCI